MQLPQCKENFCFLGGKCILPEIVYQDTAVKESETNNVETYLGRTADPFKIRYGNHLKLFRHFKYINDSELSKHIWKQKIKSNPIQFPGKSLIEGDPSSLQQKSANYVLKKSIT